MAVSDGTDYNESANIAKVQKGLNGAGGMYFRNAQHRPKLSFKDGYDRSVVPAQVRNDIPKIPIVDSWNSRRNK